MEKDLYPFKQYKKTKLLMPYKEDENLRFQELR